jgi:hypothetical protein
MTDDILMNNDIETPEIQEVPEANPVGANIQISDSNTNAPLATINTAASIDSLNAIYMEEQIKSGKSITDISTDFAKAKVTSDIIKNEDGKYNSLHKELAEEQKETLKQSFVKDKVKEQTGTITAKQEKAEAFYTSVRPILEFDFSHLVHGKKSDGSELVVNAPKTATYKDRSYGISLMCLMLALLVIPYCAFSILLAVLNGINAIFEAIATFGKVARTIATTLFIAIMMCLIVYMIIAGIDSLFGTKLLEVIQSWFY